MAKLTKLQLLKVVAQHQTIIDECEAELAKIENNNSNWDSWNDWNDLKEKTERTIIQIEKRQFATTESYNR